MLKHLLQAQACSWHRHYILRKSQFLTLHFSSPLAPTLVLFVGGSCSGYTGLIGPELSSQGPTHGEIDFVFLDNLSGQPYKVHTNVFILGKGNRERHFYLCFMLDNVPIRVLNKNQAIGVPFRNSQPMRGYSSLWNADDWATQAVNQFYLKHCMDDHELDASSRKRLQWVRKNYRVYNYCTDFKQFPQDLPPDCKQTKLH
ncbi:xyloglucan endotransglucosylase/hydrolase 12 [Actinidia rufa]|uniref:xyloglucan:xyloglucosyl transferase n=1 Tax=Actinidia rufa TaxID=165716 RepID=A0A7J0DN36_9ERIC|nr:xyloglucan endotransglucosylase/hydrolase 12 [Actinidia rufa]